MRGKPGTWAQIMRCHAVVELTCDGLAIVPMIQAKVFSKHHEDHSCTPTMQSPLDLRHLKTLVALRESGNLSRASQLLNVTQSALSHQLKLLEEHYGASLFE